MVNYRGHRDGGDMSTWQPRLNSRHCTHARRVLVEFAELMAGGVIGVRQRRAVESASRSCEIGKGFGGNRN
jgi:hypothetical protein